MRKTLLHYVVLSLLFATTHAFGDAGTEGWGWGVGCDGEGTFGSAAFTATNAGGFGGGGTCTRTSTYFTQFAFTSSSGGTLATSTLYALHTGDVLIVPPTLSTDVEPIFAVAPNCPTANQTLNWILVQWDTGANQLTNTYLMGTATYNTSSGITITGEYDVTGALYWVGGGAMTGTCSNGIYTSTGASQDLDGTVYFTVTGAGVYKTSAGHATFFFPQYYTTPSIDLGGQTAPGISFDSTTAAHTREVKVTTSTAGTIFTVQPYLNPGTATLDTTYTDTIAISQVNNPQYGILLGTVTRTGAGAGNGKIACIVNKDFDYRVFCTGQSPSNNLYPYTTTFVALTTCPANYVRVPKNPTVGTDSDFCVAKYEMANDGSGNAISSQTASPWTNIARGNGDGDGGAIAKCQSVGSGYDLISNAEWQTIAREIENAYSSPNYLNWSNGTKGGANYLNMGNMGMDGNYIYNSSTSSGLAADVDTNPCSGLTANHSNCANSASSDWAYKRTFELSNGNIIWDFAGNDYTWVKDNITTVEGSAGYAFQTPWNSGEQNLWGPLGSYSGTTNDTGLGYQTLDYSAGALIRGGYWNYGTASGVFNVETSEAASNSSGYIGFRCTWHPTAPNATAPASTGATSTGITISWTPSGGTTAGYQIAYTTGSTPPANCYSGTVISASTVGNVTSYAVTGLASSQQYSFLVCAQSEAGGLSSGVSVTATTSAPPSLPDVTDIAATAVSTTGITVSWVSGGGSTTGYQMSYQAGATAPADCGTAGTGITIVPSATIAGATSYAVTGLSANTQYSFRVCAVNTVPASSSGVTISATVATPSLYQATSTYPSGFTASLGFGSNNLAGDTILVSIQSYDLQGTVPTVIDSNSNPYTLVTSSHDINAASDMYIYIATGIAAGPNSVTVTTINSSGGDLGFHIQEWKNVKHVAAVQKNLGLSGNQTLPSISFTGPAVGFLFDGSEIDTTSVPSNFTNLSEQGGHYSRADYTIATGSGSLTPVITTTNGRYQTIFLVLDDSPYPPPTMIPATQISQTGLTLNWADNSEGPAPTGYRIERASYSGSCGTYSQIGTVSAGTYYYNDTGLSGSTTYCYRIRAYDANGTGGYSPGYQITTPSGSLTTCGTSGHGCYDNSTATTAGYALLPDGTTQVNYVPLGYNGFNVWQENNSPNRILQASGVWASSADWQQSLNINGKGFSGSYFSAASAIAGRACPSGSTLPSVYISDSNKVATGYCLYYDAGNGGAQGLNPAGTSQTVNGTIGLGSWGSAVWYEGNVQECANEGMRLPTAYETTMTSSPSNPTDATPTFAGSNGVPGGYWYWTATADTSNSNNYIKWNGTSSASDTYNVSWQVPNSTRCVLP